MEPLYVFEDNYGHKHSLIKEISRGGQGAVYRTNDSNIAVKIGIEAGSPILNDSQNAAYNKIRLLPFPKALNITLPRAVLKGASGYVMELLADMESFENLFDIDAYEPVKNEWIDMIAVQASEAADTLSKYAASGGSRRRLELYTRFAVAMVKLHGAGLVFCDISSNNVFGSSDPEKYNVWLIDSDNVNYQEITLKGRSAYYTPGYGAPEVIEDGECSMYSDAYAFAISLFLDLTLSHPFVGRRFDELCEECFADSVYDRLYSGYEPWIFDRDDDSNAKYETTIPTQIIFTDELMEMMHRMFSETGRFNTLSRPTMPELAEQIARAADLTVRCPKCGMDSIYTGKCEWCDAKQKTLKLNSFYSVSSSRKQHIWSFAREINDKSVVNIPARLTNGFIPDEADEFAFTFSKLPDGYSVSDFDYDVNVFAAENGMDFKCVYGSYRFSGAGVTLRIERRSDKRTIIVEGVVEN